MSFNKILSEMDRVIVSVFSSKCIIHTSKGDRFVEGIFDNPSVNARIADAMIENVSPTIHLRDCDAIGIEIRTLVTVENQKWLVAEMPESDGSMTKLTLSRHNEREQSSSIQY